MSMKSENVKIFDVEQERSGTWNYIYRAPIVMVGSSPDPLP